jgi:hypothetical protein
MAANRNTRYLIKFFSILSPFSLKTTKVDAINDISTKIVVGKINNDKNKLTKNAIFLLTM